MLRIQLTEMFKIAQHFKTALEECRDIKSKLPNLHKANVKKLTKKSQKKIMIFVVRLHFAMYMLNILGREKNGNWILPLFPNYKKFCRNLSLI
jgi:hypothetical protein